MLAKSMKAPNQWMMLGAMAGVWWGGEKGREREGGEERDDERSPGRLREVKNWRTADVSFESRFVRCEPGK